MEKNDYDYSKSDYKDISPIDMNIQNKFYKKSLMPDNDNKYDDMYDNKNYIKGGKKRRTRRNKKGLTKRRKGHTKRRRSHKKRHYRK